MEMQQGMQDGVSGTGRAATAATPSPTAGEVTQFRVVKKISPSRPGAVKLARHYGESLVCVRHRMDPAGRVRVTTVELIIETTPVRREIDVLVGVQIDFEEHALRGRARAEGATWDREARVWRMPLSVAHALRLQKRVVGR
jgi:hypothetical protein